MKIKIFCSASEEEGNGEKKMNEWFEENPNIIIENIKTCCNKYRFWTVLLYTEKKPLV